MVYENPYSHDEKRFKEIKSKFQLAPPMDRVLSVIFDLILHAPIFTFLSFFVMYRFNLLKLTVASSSEKFAVFMQLVWIFVVATIIFQAIYLKLFKKTPGMRIFKLQLESTSGSEVTWNQCLLRSTTWCVELLLLGIPLLGVMSHDRRQALHDRISETEIISLKSWGVLGPLPAEKSMAQMILTMVIMVALGWITAMTSMTQKSVESGTLALTDWREQGQICSEVDELASYSKIDLIPISKRLDFAIGSFIFQQIDSSCLRRELDFSIFKKVEGPLIWVGRALLSPSHSSEHKAYREKACVEDTRWCDAALFLEKVNFTQVYSNEDKKNKLNNQNGENKETPSVALLSSKLILFNRIGDDKRAREIIDEIQSLGIRATGLVAEHLKLVQRTDSSSIKSILSGLKSVMVEKDFLKLNADICLRQLESSCSSTVNECQVMKNLLPHYYKESFSDFSIARATVKLAICHNNLSEIMEYWPEISDQGLQTLLNLIEKSNSIDSKLKSLVSLRNFIKDESQKIELRFDALQFLLSQSNYEPDWQLMSYLWKKIHWTESSYLAASEWFLSEASRTSNLSFFEEVQETYKNIPGLKLVWSLYGSNINDKIRHPASLRSK